MAKHENAIMLALTESHLNSGITNSEINIPNYTPFRTDRANKAKGGIINYLRNDLASQASLILSESNSTTEIQMIHIHKYNIVIITVYRPPGCLSEEFLPTLATIRRKLEDLPAPLPTILMMGDFNFPTINWSKETISAGRLRDRNQAEELLSLAEDFFLNQFINQPTRQENILDLFFTNNEELYHGFTINDAGLSDHKLIHVTVNIDLDGAANSHTRSRVNEPALGSYNFNHTSIDWQRIQALLADPTWWEPLVGKPAEDIYQCVLNKCLELAAAYVPKRVGARERQIPHHRKVLMRKRNKLNKKYSFNQNPIQKRAIQNKINDINEKLTESKSCELKREEERAVSVIKENPKYFYKFAASKTKVQSQIGPLIIEGRTESNASKIAEALRLQYESVFSTPSETDNVDLNQEQRQLPIINNINLTIENIIKSIKTISPGAAPGPDGFPAVLLRKCADQLGPVLHLLYCTSIESGELPALWKTAKITPIHKGSSKAYAKNYRPIALTSHIVKVMEKVVVKQLTEHLEENNLLNPRQHGFRARRSCLSQLLAHTSEVLAGLEVKNSVDVIYLDFAKAFDKVDHKIVLRKLRLVGVGGNLMKWMNNFLTGRTQFVAADGAVSASSDVISGVPQGTVLGPLLFLVHIGDIDTNVTESRVASFADDTRLMKQIASPRDVELLQGDLSKVYQWADDNNMSFNNQKFQHICYSANMDVDNSYSSPEGSQITRTATVCDLGVTLQNDATYSTHIVNVVSKARRKVGLILRTFTTRERIPMLTLFKSLVLPLLEYCCQLWSPWLLGEKRALEGVQRSFTAKILNLRHLNYWERLKALGLYSLERRRERYKIIYIWKIMQGLAVNDINITSKQHIRLGRLANVDPINTRAPARIKTIKTNSLPVHGPNLFNCLPRTLREETGSLIQFKTKLDKFLQTIPDEPLLPKYHTNVNSNSIVDQLAAQRAGGNFA